MTVEPRGSVKMPPSNQISFAWRHWLKEGNGTIMDIFVWVICRLNGLCWWFPCSDGRRTLTHRMRWTPNWVSFHLSLQKAWHWCTTKEFALLLLWSIWYCVSVCVRSVRASLCVSIFVAPVQVCTFYGRKCANIFVAGKNSGDQVLAAFREQGGVLMYEGLFFCAAGLTQTVKRVVKIMLASLKPLGSTQSLTGSCSYNCSSHHSLNPHTVSKLIQVLNPNYVDVRITW